MKTFRSDLLDWFSRSARSMPWRTLRTPFRVWISEVMLQQTRVAQVIPYFERFVTRFPTIQSLSEADLDDVLKIWEGLGYYSRARNIHAAAKQIVDKHGGHFPTQYREILNLPGVGKYTASAISSLCFDQRQSVVDGNVIRVLTRLLAISDDVGRSATRRKLQDTANDLLDRDRPGEYNEAIMELGATVCTPVNPRCDSCPVASHCKALALDRATHFPVKTKRKPVPHYTVSVGIITNKDGEILINRRSEEGLLGGLWEFPGGKLEKGETLEEACAREIEEELSIAVQVGNKVAEINHGYSHFRITMHAFSCYSSEEKHPEQTKDGQPIRWIQPHQLDDFAFPRANRKLIEKLRIE